MNLSGLAPRRNGKLMNGRAFAEKEERGGRFIKQTRPARPVHNPAVQHRTHPVRFALGPEAGSELPRHFCVSAALDQAGLHDLVGVACLQMMVSQEVLANQTDGKALTALPGKVAIEPRI